MRYFKNTLFFQSIGSSFIFACITILSGCEKFESGRIVKLITDSVTSISYTSCSVQGTIIDVGESQINQHGFCWSDTPDPTTGDYNNMLGSVSSPGDYSADLTGLSANTTYYIRAYVQNNEGIFFGDQKSFVTLAFGMPTVTTSPVSDITHNSAKSGGNVIDDGSAPVTARGVCWSTSTNPTTVNSNTTDGTGTGDFTSNITGLAPGILYYVRAYATNSAGTAYGNEHSFTTTTGIPTLTTSAVSEITSTTAICGGNISSEGMAPVTARGVCWSTSNNPTIANSTTSDGTGTGDFISNLTGLADNTTYFVRAYATNSAGTAYGNEVSFRFGHVTDIDGNTYEIVQIGNQIWMKENLKTTHYADGTPLVDGTGVGDIGHDYTTKYVWAYDDNENNVADYGRLYTWAAAMNGSSASDANPSGVQGVCPNGWHLPSEAEWAELVEYLGGESVAGGKMKETGTTHWNSPNTGATNESGFTGLPSGYRNKNGTYYGLGSYGAYRSSSSEYNTSARDVMLRTGNTEAYIGSYSAADAHVVRCVKNE